MTDLPPVVQIMLSVTTARKLLTLLEECSSPDTRLPMHQTLDIEAVNAIRHEYTNEMIAHGLIRANEPTDEDYSHEDTTQGEYDDDNAWLRSAGWGEM